MRVKDYKGHVMSNSLNAFNFYKKKTGRSLEGDMMNIAKVKDFQKKVEEDKFDEFTSEEIDTLASIDAVGTLSNIYCSLRQAGDVKVRGLTFEEIIDQDGITLEDIESVEFMEVITYLLGRDEKSKK